ncbi:ATP-binding protein [Halomicroarcula sp. GCM10025709]|uniref:ATP-binding protein n=1 Tax=Haloarcula TaxID=2237 RepID=UPI0024C43ACA|nr:HAMP domain-containing sensor histidine kinase [Halomicroarcula sp. YJ-61-S]
MADRHIDGAAVLDSERTMDARQAVVLSRDEHYVDRTRSHLGETELGRVETVDAVGAAVDVVALDLATLDLEPSVGVDALDGIGAVLLIAATETAPETVVDGLEAGATDYVERAPPQGGPPRVASAIEHTAGATETQPPSFADRFRDALSARRHADARLSAVLDCVPIPAFLKDETGRYVACNDAFASFVDRDRDAIIGSRTAEFQPELAEVCDAAEAELLDGGGSERLELTVELGGEQRDVVVERHGYSRDGNSGIVGAIQDVTVQQRREAELREQTRNLEILNQVTRHDIRNDMQVILGMADVLHGYVDDEGMQYLDRLAESGQHVVDLTRQARDLTETMLSGHEELTTVSLRPVLEAQVDEVGSAYDRAVVTVEETLPDTAVVADELLSSVFRNIIANGIQHNDSEVPRVTVSASTGEEVAEVRIADNGPGVPDERKQEIFGRGEKGLESSGTGLGLYLVDNLVEKYGGEVRVVDGDEGAEFVVELPLATDITADEQ